ncbi:hypothetical protein F2P81_011012 [Scophthalmus maximus]|uniref:Uncharacterized protein n=1 Tax=Scophthalmus maximus TaxID=52904 RepID=A0A6A4SUX2_SCOMX|nr:hypothetical protein F2P81_011012 [Scophthalmus maximus]
MEWDEYVCVISNFNLGAPHAAVPCSIPVGYHQCAVSLCQEIAAYLITFEKHEEWLTTSPKTRNSSPAAAAAAALQNETESLQTASKHNAFIKTYSSGATPEGAGTTGNESRAPREAA